MRYCCLFFVEQQRHTRQPQEVEIAKDRPPADAALEGQRVRVVTPTGLQQAD